MLADILTEIFTNAFIEAGICIKNKAILFVFGFLVTATGASLLIYLYLLPSITVENYYNTEINYSHVYVENHKEYSNIVLVSDGQNYNIHSRIWQQHYSSEIIVKNLSDFRRAKIWLGAPNSHNVKGIITPNFSIEPSLGIALDKDGRNAWNFIGWLFAGLGSFLIITLLLVGFTEKKPKRNWWL